MLRQLSGWSELYAAPVPGVLSCGAYVPYRRLDRSAIATVFGGTPGKGRRSVASFDEDTTSMAVEAARACLRSAPDATPPPDSLWFSTTEPTYLDKTNATAIHAALQLDPSCPALDANGAVRSAVGALRAGLTGRGTTLAVAADIRTGLPTSGEESTGGDAAAALLLGDGPGVAELVGSASVTQEFTDRWRVPGEHRSRLWEDRFGEQAYLACGDQAWDAGLKDAQLTRDDVDVVVVAGTHARAVSRLRSKLNGGDDLSSSVGMAGAAGPGLLLTSALESSSPGQVIALLVLADGADVFLFRRTEAAFEAARPVATQAAGGAEVPYGKFLAWRQLVTVEPPNRPEPARVSSSAAARRLGWKYGLVVDDRSLADEVGTIVSFTIDHLVYSPSPPVVFAIVDFEGGARVPCELTDVHPAEVETGMRVEMTFRRLFTSDGIANYFWKARPVR